MSRLCVVCHEKIPAKRLAASPLTAHCVTCLNDGGDVERYAIISEPHISDHHRSIDVRTIEENLHDATAVAATGDFLDFEEEDIPAHELTVPVGVTNGLGA